MRFRIISKIAIALAVVLVLVVLSEFALLNLYVKETDANFPRDEHIWNDGLGGLINDPANIRLLSTSSPKESKIKKQNGKADDTKR